MTACTSKNLLAAVYFLATGVANNKVYWILHLAAFTEVPVIIKHNLWSRGHVLNAGKRYYAKIAIENSLYVVYLYNYSE